MKLDIYPYTNKGSRDHNEDSYGIKSANGRHIAVLCDGLGGHNCGEVASENAVNGLIKGLSIIQSLQKDHVMTVLRTVNNAILKMQESKPELRGMRTTAVGCIAAGTEMHYFNVGDSRFYYFSNGSLSNMSKDHSVSQMSVDLGEMSFDEIRFDNNRNRLIKVLGEKDTADVGTVYTPIKCRPGDAFLLCSDGFWEYVLEDEMEIDLSKAKNSKEWIESMLVRLLLKRTGNNDNFTVIGGMIK